MATDRAIFDNIVGSLGYKTTVGPQDKAKVQKALAGQPSVRPSSKLGQAAWDLARRITRPTPVPPPPDPVPKPPDPPTYLKVAPITVREEGGSDQMVCLWAGAPGDVNNLQPGVVRLPNGEFTDDSGAKYAADGDGRENSGVRSKVTDPRLVGARSMDGRSACECSPVGDPTKNTGSWTI